MTSLADSVFVNASFNGDAKCAQIFIKKLLRFEPMWMGAHSIRRIQLRNKRHC